MARKDGRTGVPRWALRTICLVGLTVLGGVLLAFENRTSLSLLPGATVADPQLDERRRAQAEARRPKEIAQQAKTQVMQAISLHRSGKEGQEVVATVMKPDDPVHKLAVEIFKNAGVSQQLVEESLKDWTKGVNMLEIGRRLQEKGVDIPAAVRQAETQGLPVRQMLREK